MLDAVRTHARIPGMDLEYKADGVLNCSHPPVVTVFYSMSLDTHNAMQMWPACTLRPFNPRDRNNEKVCMPFSYTRVMLSNTMIWRLVR